MNAAELRAQIREADDLPREPADQPWTDEKLYVRAMPLADWESFAFGDEVTMTPKVMAEIVARNLVTEDGEQVLRPADAQWMVKKNGAIVANLSAQIMRLSGLGDEGEEAVVEGFGQAPPAPPSIG